MQDDSKVKTFISFSWATDMRGLFPREDALRDLRSEGIQDDVERYLRAVMADSRPFMAEWEQLTNLGVDSPEELREDATEFWNWLFGE